MEVIERMDLQEIEEKIILLNKLKKILSKEPKSFKEMVFIKYIELRNATEVAKDINKLGYRIPSKTGERQYTSTDITEILLDDSILKKEVREEVYHLAMKINQSRKLLKRFLDEI